jgi:hypothetical protein
MKERPILFSAPMVWAILDGHKRHTRRIITPQPQGETVYWGCDTARKGFGFRFGENSKRITCPYGEPGDRLWVRETWNIADPAGDDALPEDIYGPRAPFTGCAGTRQIYWRAIYKAGNPDRHKKYGKALWRPSIHMPRWASRLTLEITGVRVERLQAITDEDAKAEGIHCPLDPDEFCCGCNTCADSDRTLPITHQCNKVSAFAALWNSANSKRPGAAWADNPWVWVIEFQRVN